MVVAIERHEAKKAPRLRRGSVAKRREYAACLQADNRYMEQDVNVTTPFREARLLIMTIQNDNEDKGPISFPEEGDLLALGFSQAVVISDGKMVHRGEFPFDAWDYWI